MERKVIKNEIIYDQSTNTLKVYTNPNDTLSNLAVIGVKRLSNINEVLKYNEMGLYNDLLKIGDGTSTFNSLPSISVEIIDSLDSSSTSSALSANQGKELKTLIDNINSSRASTSAFGLAKVGDNINSNNGILSINDSTISNKGVVQLSDSISSNSSTTAATSKAVKEAYDKAETEFIGATNNSDGVKGVVPAPLQGEENKFLKGDKTWDIPYTHPSYTAYTGNPTSNQSPSFGNTFTISQIISDSLGHITSITDRTITIPNTLVSTLSNGLMSYEDKIKLDGIDNNANNYTLPAASSNQLGGVRIGSNISMGENNEIYLSNANVLAALNKSTDTTKYLRNDGSWAVPPDNNTTYDIATTETAGLLSASDKSKLDSIDFNANYVSVDSSMSDSSTNPVQNKIVKSYIDGSIADLVDSAPTTLDTLQELATALGDDPNFATTITTELGNKVDKITGKGLSSNDYTTTEKNKLSGITESADAVSFTRLLNSGTEIGTITINGVDTKLYSTNNDNTEYDEATTTISGLMSYSDKSKLNNIENNANNYIHPTYTARTGKPLSNQSPSFGDTITISQIISDSSGHITSATDRTITIPNTKATTTTLGLVSIGSNISISDDGVISLSNSNVLNALNKGNSTTTFLRNDGSWEVPYTHPSYTSYTGKPISDLTPSFGDSITISQVSTNSLGHVTSITDKNITIPSTKGSTSTFGLLKIGDNITVLDGVISISKINTLNALNSGSDTTKYLRNDGTWAIPYTHPAYTTTTGIETTNQTPGFGGTFNISQVLSDNTGHITSQNTRTVTIPNNVATQSSDGLMSSTDKIKLDSINLNRAAFVAKNNITVSGGAFVVKNPIV